MKSTLKKTFLKHKQTLLTLLNSSILAYVLLLVCERITDGYTTI